MLQSVLWSFRTLAPERKALITVQDELIGWGLMNPPGAVHRLGKGHYYWRSAGDGWVCRFERVQGKHAVQIAALERYVQDKGEPQQYPDCLGRPLALLSRPPEWW